MQGQDKPLWTFLAKVRRRWVTLAVLRGSARVFGSVGVIVLVAVMVDTFWLPTGLSLIALALTAAVVAIGQALLIWWPLRKTPSPRQVARFIVCEKRSAPATGNHVQPNSTDRALIGVARL